MFQLYEITMVLTGTVKLETLSNYKISSLDLTT